MRLPKPAASSRYPAVVALSRALGQLLDWLLGDAYLLYTSTLAPVVIAVALAARRPGEIWIALAASTVAITVQALLGRRHRTRSGRGALWWTLLRLGVPVLLVGVCVRLIGGSALPLLALFAPVVAGAAAIGPLQGWVIAGVATVIYLGPELGSLGAPEAVALRGLTLSGVALVLAFGTRRIVRALEQALTTARAAVLAERRRARQIEALDALGRLLADDRPASEILAEVIASVPPRFGYAHVSVYLGDEHRVELAAQHGYAEALPAFEAGAGVAGGVMRTRQLALVRDVAADASYLPGTMTATSLISAPLLVGDRFLGVLNVETTGHRTLDATDQSLVGTLADRIATSLALRDDRERLAERAEVFRRIEQFGRDVSSSLSVGTLAEVLVEAVGRVVAADTLAVTLLDRADGRYRVHAVRGVPPSVVGAEIVAGEGVAGRAIRDRVIVIDGAVGPEKYPAAVRGLELPPLTHAIGLPLIRDAVVVGALTIARTADHPAVGELEMEALGLIAVHASLAVANAFLHAEVAELAVRDPLTGLYNRRHFDEALDRLLAAHRRERVGSPRAVTAIVFDLDHFGAFNKQHGHQVGDAVLRLFADVLRSRFRESDLVARLGGEEFIAVLDRASLDDAIGIADEVRATLAGRHVRADDGELRVTVSAGCAALDPAEPTRAALLRTADVALFMAKRAGRDRVVAA